ncbi:DUF349 domain-containing protein [Thiocystis violacea]|uniref:DUF349 domain-containing protein n=1 Tax=Thiocystis violacea TaxID=13725 RepID=UPI001904715C|nr:DUF349 domain-containing protein [Thiocystis violacea]MBK1717965.1 hypothetical protein [Thiocystis violacea]
MLFQRFLKRLKPNGDETRPAVVQPTAKSRNQDALNEQASSHPEASQRRAALLKVDDPSLVARILTQDPDADVREAAAARFRDLLCEPLSGEGVLEPLLDGLARIEDSASLERIATRGHRPEIRRAAIERLHSPAILADRAVQDPLAANRALAIERLEDKAALEEVARRIGKKDKHVYRTAREKLRLIAEQEELPRRIREQCEEILAKIERLGRLGQWAQDRALLEHLDRQWAGLQDHADPESRARFQSERERFLAAHEAHARENTTQIAEREAGEAVRAKAEALLEAFAQLQGQQDEETLTAEGERLAAAWEALPAKHRAALEPRYRELTRATHAARQTFASQRDLAGRLSKTATRIERMLGESKPLDQKKARQLLDQGGELLAQASDADSAQAFQALAERLETRLHNQRKHAEQRLQPFSERLAELETHLAEGELRKADPLYQSLLAGLEVIQTSGIRPSETAGFAQRLRALAPRLRELQNWRRWGADQHREGLCADMEALIEQELPLDILAERLHAFQMDWKGLDKTGSPANQALWERFHQASETVYARCRPHMEALAVERETNRIAREQACERIEDFLSKVDWEHVDWKKTLHAERDMRQGWAAIGATEGRARKQLERRFHQSLRRLDQRLDAERKRNQAHKLDLIEQVRALAEQPDLEDAIERTKALQREWHTTVPARQKDENKLWQRFRAACDAVFERRATRQQAHVHELEENLATREAICAEADELAASERDPRRLAAARRELIERWRAAESLPVPRQSAGPLAQRWQHCQAALEQRHEAAEHRRRLDALNLLRRQAELCERLELGLLGETDEGLTPEAARQTWATLPTQADTGLQRAIEARLELAMAAAEDPAKLQAIRQSFATNRERLERLCLQLEIIAGVETPPEFAQQRLEYQVARLAERMVEGEEDPLRGAGGLIHEWYLSGPAPRDASLEVRFERVRRVLAPDPSE